MTPEAYRERGSQHYARWVETGDLDELRQCWEADAQADRLDAEQLARVRAAPVVTPFVLVPESERGGP